MMLTAYKEKKLPWLNNFKVSKYDHNFREIFFFNKTIYVQFCTCRYTYNWNYLTQKSFHNEAYWSDMFWWVIMGVWRNYTSLINVRGILPPNNRPPDVLSLRERPIDFHLGIHYTIQHILHVCRDMYLHRGM